MIENFKKSSRLQYLCSHTVLGLAQDVTNFDQWLNLVLGTTTTWGGFFNIFFIIITYISNVFTSIGNILSKIRLIGVRRPIVIILRLNIALNFIRTNLHPHFLHIIIGLFFNFWLIR